jgi:hypothetical protein
MASREWEILRRDLARPHLKLLLLLLLSLPEVSYLNCSEASPKHVFFILIYTKISPSSSGSCQPYCVDQKSQRFYSINVDVATVLLLDALHRLVPSVRIFIH